MHKSRNLILNPLHELGMRMSNARGKDPAEEIEVLAAVEVLDARPVGLRDDDGLGVIVGNTRKEEVFVFLANGLRVHQCVGSRFKNWPRPIVPVNSPSRACTFPRTVTTAARPFCSQPSYAL